VGAKTTKRPPLRRIEAIINLRAGRCGPASAQEMSAIFEAQGLTANISEVEPAEVGAALARAKKAKPDLVVILAGDGTARSAAEVFGPRGPLLAPLPGGTMNMLPKALYGEAIWQDALAAALTHGVARDVGGGTIGGHTFYVAAMVGATALFAPAREAARERRLADALQKAVNAYRRAFAGRVRFQLEGGVAAKSQSVTLMCPMISKVMAEDDRWMEIAAIDPHSPAEALRVGARVIVSRLVGDWRDDPAVSVGRARRGKVWANFALPALIDGEPVRLGRSAEFSFNARAFRALAPHTELEEKV